MHQSSNFPLRTFVKFRRLKSYETFTVSRKLLNCCRLRSLCNFSFLMYASASITSREKAFVFFSLNGEFFEKKREMRICQLFQGERKF